MSQARLTVDEVIGTLQRSSEPTLLAEGIDDITMLRRLEDEFYAEGLSIMPLGGRSAVLEVFERRNEIPLDNVVLFLADKDFWVYSGVPEEYQSEHLLFTDGYSIENDLYRDGDPERLLTASEKDSFKRNLREFLHCYAILLSRKLRGEVASLSVHPKAVLSSTESLATHKGLVDGETFPQADFERLESDYKRILRGKSLMALILLQLSDRSRRVKHSSSSLLEHGAVAGGTWLERIRMWLRQRLAPAPSVASPE